MFYFKAALLKQIMTEDVPMFLEKFEKFLVNSDKKSGYFASEKVDFFLNSQ